MHEPCQPSCCMHKLTFQLIPHLVQLSHQAINMFAQELVDIQMAAITNENVYTTQAMEALLFFRIDTELVAGAEQALDDSSNLLPLHVSCQRHF